MGNLCTGAQSQMTSESLATNFRREALIRRGSHTGAGRDPYDKDIGGKYS